MNTMRRTAWAFPLACAAALATLLAAYSNSFDNSFHFDDAYAIQSNLSIRSLRNLPEFFRDAHTSSSLPDNATYRPLVTATFALDYWLGGGLNVRQFHLSQLAMLVALGVMACLMFLSVLGIAREDPWDRYAALAAAALFAAHTTNTETMNLIQVRSELLSAMGVAGSFVVYLRFPRSRARGWYLLPMIIGALAKSPSVTFAPLLLLYVFLFEQRLSAPDLFDSNCRPQIRAAIAKCLPAFCVGVLVYLAVSGMDAPETKAAYPGLHGFRLDYPLTQAFAWLHYGRLFLLPLGLSADTDLGWIRDWYDTRVIAGACFIALILRVAWISSKEPSLRPVAFGILWFCIALLPASSIMPLTEPINDHRPFLAFIGLSLAAVTGVQFLLRRAFEASSRLRPATGPALCALAIFAIGGNAVGTYVRNRAFLTEETLWRDVTLKSPTNSRGLMNYGLSQAARGRYAEAKQLFERALFYAPNYSDIEINLGIVCGAMGQEDAAREHFARALQLKPDGNAHFYLARWLLEQEKTAEAIPHLEQAVALSPGDLNFRYLLLRAYALDGRTSEMKALAQATLRLAPGDAEAQKALDDPGAALRAQSDAAVGAAARLLAASLRQAQAGRFKECLDAASQAVKLNPKLAAAFNNIGYCAGKLQLWDEAIRATREAIRLDPSLQIARNNLALITQERVKAGVSKGPDHRPR